jgi:hypothetical protein
MLWMQLVSTLILKVTQTIWTKLYHTYIVIYYDKKQEKRWHKSFLFLDEVISYILVIYCLKKQDEFVNKSTNESFI